MPRASISPASTRHCACWPEHGCAGNLPRFDGSFPAESTDGASHLDGRFPTARSAVLTARSLNLGSGRHPRFGEGVGKLPPLVISSGAKRRQEISPLQQRSVQQHGVVVGELEARIDSLERVDAHVIRDDESINHVELKIGRAVIGTIK